MDKYCCLILKYLNKNSSSDNYICLERLVSTIQLDTTIVENSLKSLVHANYIDEKVTISEDGETAIVYSSTIKGREYFKLKYLKLSRNAVFKVFIGIITHVAFPILVAYLTTRFTINTSDCCKITSNNDENSLYSDSN